MIGLLCGIIAPRGATDVIAQQDFAPESGREIARPRFDGDKLVVVRAGEDPTKKHLHRFVCEPVLDDHGRDRAVAGQPCRGLIHPAQAASVMTSWTSAGTAAAEVCPVVRSTSRSAMIWSRVRG